MLATEPPGLEDLGAALDSDGPGRRSAPVSRVSVASCGLTEKAVGFDSRVAQYQLLPFPAVVLHLQPGGEVTSRRHKF